MQDVKPVVLIIAHKEQISKEEAASLVQCFKILGKHAIRLIFPKGKSAKVYTDLVPNLQVDYIDPIWQSTYENFNKLKVSRFLLKRYANYTHILYYELDAWVFRDELIHWCQSGYDYIGAPWFEGWGKIDEPTTIVGVGNGGFSLRNIKSCLKVLNSFRYLKPPSEILKGRLENCKKWTDNLRAYLGFILDCTIRNNCFWLFNNLIIGEDVFWSEFSSKKFSWYKVAPVDVAITFSFEAYPAYMLKLNKNKIPFGCHAWEKYDKIFWKNYIKLK